MSRPLLLDLFCGAGGAAAGYHRAGFDVVGVDNQPQPRYPYRFIRADALAVAAALADRVDAIHASPPCQAHTALKAMHNARDHADLIPATRAILERAGRPYVIENVPGAPLIDPVTLCGTMFGLEAAGADLRRHRAFESNVAIEAPPCRHRAGAPVLGVYGGHLRNRRRPAGTNHAAADFPAGTGHAAMGIDWPMTLEELSQALPPAYTAHVGRFLLAAIEAGR